LNEPSNKELKLFQRDLKSLERKKEGLSRWWNKFLTLFSYASKNKVDLIKIEKEIKAITAKIKSLKK
jgi:hypothetical protein